MKRLCTTFESRSKHAWPLRLSKGPVETSQQWAISNNVYDDPQKGCFQKNRRFPHCWLIKIAGINGKTQRFSQRYLIQARQLHSLPVINSRIGKTRFGLNSRAKDQSNSYLTRYTHNPSYLTLFYHKIAFCCLSHSH